MGRMLDAIPPDVRLADARCCGYGERKTSTFFIRLKKLAWSLFRLSMFKKSEIRITNVYKNY